MTLKQKLRKLLEENGRGTKARLAKFLQISPVYITRYAGDEYDDTNMPSKYFTKTAQFFGIDANYFLDNSLQIRPVKKIPIVGNSSCGLPSENDYQIANEFAYYNGNYYTPDLYCIIASGDSMAPEIEDGDEVICDPKAEVLDGDMVHYTIGNESAIKLYVRDEEAFIIQFIPYNQNETYKTKTIRLDDEEAKNVRIAKIVSVNKLKFNNRKARLKLIGRG